MTNRRVGATLLFLAAGCNRAPQESQRPDSSSSIAATRIDNSSRSTPASENSSRNATVARAPANNNCKPDGRWALCSVEKRLAQSGFVVKRIGGDAPRRAGFGVGPTAYSLGGSRLEVFIYSNEAQLARDFANIDTLTAAPRGTSSVRESTPTLVRSANLAAVFLTDSRARAERLTLALTAGPPQPASSR